MPHGTTGNELAYYRQTMFENAPLIKKLNVSLILERKTKAIFERHHYYPTDYFFFEYEGRHYFGRKTLSYLFLTKQQPYKKCNQLKAFMIIGLVLRTQTTEKGNVIFHKPLSNPEKLFLFNELKSDKKIDIYFPFPVLNGGLNEHVQPIDAWDPSDDMAEGLNAGEEHMRQYTLDYLSKHELDGKRIYDPACSTGKFLTSIKERFPEAITIGQDINPQMIEHAKKHSKIDELHVGNALYPCVEKESVDFIFIRFLNLSVLSSHTALKLFNKLANCCKTNGEMIIFGFTPVLLSAEICEMMNLTVLQSTAYSKENDSVFQYYVLKKAAPIVQYRYEDFSLLKHANLQKEVNNIQPANQFRGRSKL